jgi:hypothetical protein
VGIFDGDYASMTFASDDPAAGKATYELIINAIVTNPRVMRQMPQLLQDAGLRLTAAFSYIVADVGRGFLGWFGEVPDPASTEGRSDDGVSGPGLGRGDAGAIQAGDVLRGVELLRLRAMKP